MSHERTVLVVDDDPLIRETLEDWLADRGLRSRAVDSAGAALAAMNDQAFDAVLSDIMMPGQSGMELLAQLHAARPDLPVILMTGFASVDSAVAAMRAGAFDY